MQPGGIRYKDRKSYAGIPSTERTAITPAPTKSLEFIGIAAPTITHARVYGLARE